MIVIYLHVSSPFFFFKKKLDFLLFFFFSSVFYKPLCRGLTLNRLQQGNCSASLETPSQKQVIYEWFSTRLPMNMGCLMSEGEVAFLAMPYRKLLILEVKFNVLLLLHLNTIVCIKMWWLIFLHTVIDFSLISWWQKTAKTLHLVTFNVIFHSPNIKNKFEA